MHAVGGGEALNSYHYVSGNLLQARDPLGLCGPYEDCDPEVEAAAGNPMYSENAPTDQSGPPQPAPTVGTQSASFPNLSDLLRPVPNAPTVRACEPTCEADSALVRARDEFFNQVVTFAAFVSVLAMQFVPGVGEAIDLVTALTTEDETTRQWSVATLAGGALLGAVSEFTPNFGVLRLADELADPGGLSIRQADDAFLDGGGGGGLGASGGLPDDAVVCRGGTCTAERFANGSGVTLDSSGHLQGVSVNTGPTLEAASVGIPNGQVGATTAGQIRAAGGQVVSSPTTRNPNHATLSGVTPQQAEQLFTPTVPNPSRGR